MTKIKAIFFDMDGVLIDAKDWHYEALNKALNFFGMAIDRYDHLVTYDGLPTKKKLEMLTMEKNLPLGLHPFIYKLKQQYTVNEILVKCKPQFTHQYALSRLKNEGFRLAVCSNSIGNTIQLMLERADLLQYCDFFLSNEDVEFCKPHPEMYVKAMQRLSVGPKECLIIEDNPQGLKAAADSGAYSLEVRDTSDVHYENIMNRIKEIDREK